MGCLHVEQMSRTALPEQILRKGRGEGGRSKGSEGRGGGTEGLVRARGPCRTFRA